jgi:hypothetical protein
MVVMLIAKENNKIDLLPSGSFIYETHESRAIGQVPTLSMHISDEKGFQDIS